MYPYFHQNWNLFAPVPHTNYRLFARIDSGKSNYTEVMGELIARHRANRLAGYEPLVIAFSNSIHYFEKNCPMQGRVNGPVKDDLYFTILEKATWHYLHYTQRINTEPLKLLLLVEDTKGGQKRVYFN